MQKLQHSVSVFIAVNLLVYQYEHTRQIYNFAGNSQREWRSTANQVRRLVIQAKEAEIVERERGEKRC